MLDATKRALAAIATNRFAIGQILVRPRNDGGFLLCHRQDERTECLQVWSCPDDAREIARIDDRGSYRPLKTAPNLCHGWRLELQTLEELEQALDYFYPGRLPMLEAWNEQRLQPTTLRDTLNRQSGMYRVAATISDGQLDAVVANCCRSDGGCLRTILWRRNAATDAPSSKLPAAKFDPDYDQMSAGEPAAQEKVHVPLLCQEACNLLVAECRKVVKSNERAAK
jgi:sirohydrochlorin cobaltochelatase